MRTKISATILAVMAGLVILWHGGGVRAQITLATGPDAEVTGDGLHRVDPSLMGTAWVTPELDLSRYTRIYFMPTAVQFRDVAERRYTARSMETAESFFITDVRKTRLRELFRENFHEAIGEMDSYELTDEVGRDVLMVRGILADVISGVPPDMAGSISSGIRWAWETTIVLELRDAMSDDVVARTANRERIDGPFDVGLVSTMTPRFAADWSRLLVGRLEELSELAGE